jgi:hypothetical protein
VTGSSEYDNETWVPQKAGIRPGGKNEKRIFMKNKVSEFVGCVFFSTLFYEQTS